MKKTEERCQTEFLLLNSILTRYLEKAFKEGSLAPRYLETDSISDIVTPFFEMKYLIQRVEWLDEREHVEELLRFMVANRMSAEELNWAVDMYAVHKQDVLNRIGKGV